LSNLPQWVRVALVLRAHGLGGEVAVELLGGDRERLRPGLVVRSSAGQTRIESVRGGGRQLICQLADASDRDAVAALCGSYLEVAASELRPLPAGEWFHFQLLGLEVRDGEGRVRGELVDIEAYPAHDVYVVRTPAAELRVPAVREAVLAIDLEQQRITMADRFLEEWVDAV
jgi:16S rRNA processing protein RimM